MRIVETDSCRRSVKLMDRGKVMSWLEGLAEDDWRSYHSDSEVSNIAKSALALLKVQEPVEPELEGGGSSWWHVCGDCHGMIDKYDNFCRHCGRRIKHEKKE